MPSTTDGPTFLLSCYLPLWKVIDEQGCNPSCLDEYKYTPLHCAAMSRSMNVVKFLTVEKCCDPMCRDYTQTTPLHRAALSGQIEVVKFLTVKMHYNPMSRNNNNDTVINPGIQNGHHFSFLIGTVIHIFQYSCGVICT